MQSYLFNTIFSWDHQQECNKLIPILHKITICISDSQEPTRCRTRSPSNNQEEECSVAYGIITCREYQTLEAIKTRMDDQNEVPRLLLGGCLSVNNGKVKIENQVIIYVRLNKDYVKRAYILYNLSWYRRIWSLTSRADVLAFTGVYYSVLGGAYSSLGKTNLAYAHKAKFLALRQIQLAQWLKDRIWECKCWLYYAEDLIQLKRFKRANKIIRRETEFASLQQNDVLIRMCQSVQAKLQTARHARA
ncbi:hypothetical protein EC973_005176 [Apophysomyces ossiformis]|uniref:Uncharacterized protein n=1 Tax=Apophysomyces ossiformis TaxID=679940 RepID=A0A8H7BWH8_9FUNG|nr:hypothetical protein EC973_005176 [Apophysomyces ossiformis]